LPSRRNCSTSTSRTSDGPGSWPSGRGRRVEVQGQQA
jgi:hypothetical protein